MTNAERLIVALYKLTEGKPGHWRTIRSIGRVGTVGAIGRATRAGWIEVDEERQIRLTDQGLHWARATPLPVR